MGKSEGTRQKQRRVLPECEQEQDGYFGDQERHELDCDPFQLFPGDRGQDEQAGTNGRRHQRNVQSEDEDDARMDRLKGTGQEGVLSKPVGDLQLSVRARKALQLLNIETIGALASRTEAELMGVKNFGATSLVEVREKLVDYGLSLRLLEEGEEPIGGLPASLPMDMSADFGVDMPPMIGGTLGGPVEPQDAQPEVGEGIPSAEDEAITSDAVDSVADEASFATPAEAAAPAAEEADTVEPAPAEGKTGEPGEPAGDAPKTLG